MKQIIFIFSIQTIYKDFIKQFQYIYVKSTRIYDEKSEVNFRIIFVNILYNETTCLRYIQIQNNFYKNENFGREMTYLTFIRLIQFSTYFSFILNYNNI